MNKKELRILIRDKKRQFSEQQLGKLSLPILERLQQNRRLEKAHHVLLYYSLPDEVNTHQYIDELVRLGKKVFLPVVVDAENMLIREYTGIHDLQEGAFHILEPIGNLLTEEDYKKIEVAVIPGMSFDKAGNRLGRGKGYYDRLLRKMPHLYKIGICFDFQKSDCVPTEPTDIKMDIIV